MSEQPAEQLDQARWAALPRILMVARRSSAQATIYALALGAIALTPEAALPALFVNLVANAISAILERLAGNQPVTDDEIRQALRQAIHETHIDQMLTQDEFQGALARLARWQDLQMYAVADARYDVLQCLDKQSQQYATLIGEMATTMSGRFDALPTREQQDETNAGLRKVLETLREMSAAIPSAATHTDSGDINITQTARDHSTQIDKARDVHIGDTITIILPSPPDFTGRDAELNRLRQAVPEGGGGIQATSDRKWIEEFPQNPAVVLAEDYWEPFCQNVDGEGVDIITEFVDTPPRLPGLLEEARKRLSYYVPDERSLENPDAPFNAPRYYLRNVISEVRRQGERPSCILKFGPSDYRTFLVTNGMDSHWAQLSGLANQWTTHTKWTQRWVGVENQTGEKFFENSFGVNVLITCWSGDSRHALFCERGGKVAVSEGTTIGSADEGLRRRFERKLFDEKSETDASPDIIKAAYRAIDEEVGISENLTEGTRPIIVSVGRVRSSCQPAALIYWPLKLSIDEVRHAARLGKDRYYEISKIHFVPFNREKIVEFVLRQEAHSPVTTWVIALAIYSLGPRGVKRQ